MGQFFYCWDDIYKMEKKKYFYIKRSDGFAEEKQDCVTMTHVNVIWGAVWWLFINRMGNLDG